MGSEAVHPPILCQKEAAFLHHNLWRALRVHPEPPRVEGDDGAHQDDDLFGGSKPKAKSKTKVKAKTKTKGEPEAKAKTN